LGEITKFIDYRGKTPSKTGKGVPLITAKNVRFGYLSKDPQEFINDSEYSSWMTRGIPEYGDILFTTEAPLGNVAQLNLKEKVALAQRIITIHPYGTFVKAYMKYLLMSKPIRDLFVAKATGTTAKGIKASKLKLIPIPVPGVNEQTRIVAKVDQLMQLCNELEDKLKQSKQDAERLMRAVLQEGFEQQ
jgi:type I restriction enzyme S subunit